MYFSELARAEQRGAAVTKVYESQTHAPLQSDQNVQPTPPIPPPHITIVAKENAVVNAPIIVGNETNGAITASTNVDTVSHKSSLLQYEAIEASCS